MEKDIVLWGAGHDARMFLVDNSDKIKFVIDSDITKVGTNLYDKPVIDKSDIKDWSNYFIIITSRKYENEIANHLYEMGLKRYVNFVTIDEYSGICDIENIEDTLEQHIFGTAIEKNVQISITTRNYEEYTEFVTQSDHIKRASVYSNIFSDIYSKKLSKQGMYIGICSVCRKKSRFKVNFNSNRNYFNNRESFVCECCGLNARMRMIIEIVQSLFNEHDSIYIYERCTKTFDKLQEVFPNIIGSEYFGNQYKSGDLVNGILHEDAQNLSFKDELFDLMISNDVFEHVSEYIRAFKEAYRCLKKGGLLLFTIPFDVTKKTSTIRARITNGEIDYIHKPLYHGNPISDKGSLVFTDFGWDLLDKIRGIGFKDINITTYFSSLNGYLGIDLMYFKAIK